MLLSRYRLYGSKWWSRSARSLYIQNTRQKTATISRISPACAQGCRWGRRAPGAPCSEPPHLPPPFACLCCYSSPLCHPRCRRPAGPGRMRSCGSAARAGGRGLLASAPCADSSPAVLDQPRLAHPRRTSPAAPTDAAATSTAHATSATPMDTARSTKGRSASSCASACTQEDACWILQVSAWRGASRGAEARVQQRAVKLQPPPARRACERSAPLPPRHRVMCRIATRIVSKMEANSMLLQGLPAQACWPSAAWGQRWRRRPPDQAQHHDRHPRQEAAAAVRHSHRQPRHIAGAVPQLQGQQRHRLGSEIALPLAPAAGTAAPGHSL